MYLGSKIRIGAVISDGALVWADLRDEEAEGLTVGMPVDLSWPPSAASVWPELKAAVSVSLSVFRLPSASQRSAVSFRVAVEHHTELTADG